MNLKEKIKARQKTDSNFDVIRDGKIIVKNGKLIKGASGSNQQKKG